MKNKNLFAQLALAFVAVAVTSGVVFFVAKHQAFSATVTRDGAASINTQRFAFPARSGTSTFQVVSLPETQYVAGNVANDPSVDDSQFVGSSIFTMWDGTATTSNYVNFAHMGQNSETSDNFLLQFFNQTQCIANPDGKSVPGNLKDKKFTATFVKPNLLSSLETTTKAVVRAYDDFTVEWGNGQVKVTMQRYWRKINLPDGTTSGALKPNDYNIQKPEDSDVVSASAPVIMVLPYDGDFAPLSTRVGHGDPYDTEKFARPAQVLVDGQENFDFNFFDISTSAEGEGTSPDEVSCRLNTNTTIVEKTQPCGCLNNADQKTCGDPEVPFVDLWPPVQFSLASGTQWQVENISDLRDGISSYGEQFMDDAIVRLELNGYDPSPGSKYVAQTFISNFRTKPENAYFSWCFNGKSQQGLVAGGEWITETKSTTATLDADASGCCDFVTRTPAKDANKDGIDDEWQLKYGYKLTGNKDYMLPANYDDDVAAAGDPAGVTGDGFVADQFLDTAGARIAVTPGTITAKKNNFPNGQELPTGDGHFTAAEEYIWGTDPTEYDSDFDGYPDEADIVGIGQQKVEFISQLQPRDFPTDDTAGNDRYNLKVKTLGRTGQKRPDTIDVADQQTETGLDLQNVVRIAEDTKDIFARDPGSLTVGLQVKPETPGLNDSFVVSSNLSQGSRLGGNPKYSWFFKRIPGNGNNPAPGPTNGKTAAFSGEGLSSIDLKTYNKHVSDICPECAPGDELQITVQVEDTVRGSVTSNTTSLSIGLNNSLQVFQDCNKDGADEEVGSGTYCFKSSGVTKNIPVRVAVNFLDAVSDDYIFKWKLDSVLQTSNCLLKNETSTTTPRKCGLGTSQMVFTPTKDRKNYSVEVLVYKNDRNIPEGQQNLAPSAAVAHFTTTVASGTPAVTIIFEPAPGDNGGYAPGSAVTARAYVDFLDPKPLGQLAVDPKVPDSQDGAHALRYVWRSASDGSILKVDEISSIDGSTLAIQSPKAGIFGVSVEVVSPDYTAPNNTKALIPLAYTNQAYFGELLPESSLIGLVSVRLAAILGFIPEPLVKMIQVLGVAAFGVILVLGFAYIPRKLRQK